MQNQTYANLEIIVVDDGSTDGTEAYVTSIQDERVRYVRLPENKGPAGARNEGVKLAHGAYIAFQDSDTLWEADKLEKQLQKMLQDDYVLVYHSYILNGQQVLLGEISLQEKEGNIFIALLYSPMIGTPCMLVKKDIFERVGGFKDNLRCLEDYEFSLRIARTGKIGFIEEVLLYSEDSEGAVSKNVLKEMETLFYIMEVYFKELEIHAFAKKLIFNRISKLAVENSYMEIFYENLQKYLDATEQSVEDVMALYK